MAEFTKVMRQYNRLCAEYRSGRHKKYCDECPVSSIVNGKDATCTEVMRSDPEWFDKTVMDWAAAHPEPKYPTWEEWQKANFPTAIDVMHPCAFMSAKEVEKIRGVRCTETPCNECARIPIPAEIAEKLGIKPIGGDENG